MTWEDRHIAVYAWTEAAHFVGDLALDAAALRCSAVAAQALQLLAPDAVPSACTRKARPQTPSQKVLQLDPSGEQVPYAIVQPTVLWLEAAARV